MKKSLFLGMAALLMAGITSCSNDDTATNVDGTFKTDRTFFANINIGNVDSMTRAGEEDGKKEGDYDYSPDSDPNFSKGEPEESTVKSVYLIFYDSEGNRVSTTQVRRDNFEGSDFGSGETANNGQSIFSGVVQIDVKHGSNKPAYVMCFINPITSQNFEINPDFATLKALQATTRPRIIDNNNNFAMSKSVYYGADRSDKNYTPDWDKDVTKYKKIVATPLGEGQLFDTEEAALKAVTSDEGVVNIYVERYAAKVNFSIAPAGKNEVMVEGKKLVFVPEYWAVNAYESETYICKSFLNRELTEDMDYKTMNNALGGDVAWFWNNPVRHRCYWAQTPAYYAMRYPRVADDILDKEDGAEYYALGYYSYNDMVANAADEAKEWTDLSRKARNLRDAADKIRPIYARENTVSGGALKDASTDPAASPKAAVASVALVGHYTIDDVEVGEDKTFYVMGNATNGYKFFDNDRDMVTYFVNTTIPFYKGKSSNDAFYEYGIDKYGFIDEYYRDYFIIEHPKYSVRASGIYAENPLVIDSRFVTIQLNAEKIADAEFVAAHPIYAYLNNEYVAVTKSNIDEINQQMLLAAGTVQGFNGGKAYFTIPIKHLGFYRSGNVNSEKNANDKTFDWSNVQSGDFGLVRNHVYTITVDKITGLGNAIPNPDDPIVPPTDPEEYFIGARIIVLNWAVVPTQHESL